MEVQNPNESPRPAIARLYNPALTAFPRTIESDRALADIVVLNLENRDLFLKLLARLREEYRPATYTECIAVENIAVNRWHQRRYASVKQHILNRQADPEPVQGPPLFTFLEEVCRMERRADRAVRAQIAMFNTIRQHYAARPAAVKNSREAKQSEPKPPRRKSPTKQSEPNS